MSDYRLVFLVDVKICMPCKIFSAISLQNHIATLTDLHSSISSVSIQQGNIPQPTDLPIPPGTPIPNIILLRDNLIISYFQEGRQNIHSLQEIIAWLSSNGVPVASY